MSSFFPIENSISKIGFFFFFFNIMFIFLLSLSIVIAIVLVFFYIFSSFSSFYNVRKPITYTFWTGGFDSTFRICELVMVQKKVVQPVYVSAVIDNVEESSTRRQSHRQELACMQRIRDMLPEEARRRLLPLLNIREVKLDDDIKMSMNSLYRKKKMRRPVCQYGALAQVTRDLRRPIEVAVEYAPGNSMLYHCVQDSLDCGEIQRGSGIVAHIQPRNDPDVHIFQHFVFPTISYSKEDMLKIARENRFDYILHSTWSCWYPREDGSPCRKCIMCLERIV